MKHLLQLHTSLRGAQGESSRLAQHFVDRLTGMAPELEIRERDLGQYPVPHLDVETFEAFTMAPDQRTDRQRRLVSISDALIDELKWADAIVLGLPMYNFGVPSTLKAYFDQVARAGLTFRYTSNGPEGLIRGKKVYVFAARGGKYRGTPLDTQTDYVRNFLSFLGMKDVQFVYAEGLAMGESVREAAIHDANTNTENFFNGAVDLAA
jgi:FMN-dependent NADH-azoreductase